jgi:hypothetical protein
MAEESDMLDEQQTLTADENTLICRLTNDAKKAASVRMVAERSSRAWNASRK